MDNYNCFQALLRKSSILWGHRRLRAALAVGKKAYDTCRRKEDVKRVQAYLCTLNDLSMCSSAESYFDCHVLLTLW